MSATPARMNPFPGLRPFTQEEDYLFFGREEQTIELLQRLGSNRFVAVVGTSGSGKSSLVRCGLLSELLGGRMLEAGAAWEIAVTHPGGNPLALLTDALLDADLYDRDAEHARENLLATLSRSHFGLVEAVKQADLGAGTNFLLVVDQFEEVFRFHEAGQRQQEVANEFVSLLLEAAAQKEAPIYVVLTMRSDFIGECGQFEGLAEMVNRGEFLIPRLTREQYKRVVEGPIKVAGGQIAPRLLQRLLNDLGQQADQLPCLQHALMRTWNVWAERGDTDALDLDDYQRVGKMSQALSLHADEIYESLASDRQRALCRGIFQALTVEESNSRGIRRPQRLGRLCQILEVPADDLRPIIDAYRQSGVTFLMPAPGVELTEQTIVDISHESLMRVWTRLRQWVEEETQAAGIYHRLSESADLHERGKAGLYRDPELGIALAWREAKRPNAAWAERYRPGFAPAIGFLEASQQASVAEEQSREAARQRELHQAQQLAEAQQLRLEQQQRSARKLRTMIGGLAVVAMVAGIACIAALVANKRANDLRELASQEAERAEKSAADAQQAERATAEALAKVESQKEEVVASLARTETAGNEAREAAKQARAAEEQGRKLLYATDMQLAPFIWNDPQATAAQLRSRLDTHDPEKNKELAGKDDLRGFEWRYYKHLLENSSTLLNADAITDLALADDGRLVTLDQQSRLKRWDPDTHLETASANLGLLARFVKTQALSPNGQRLARANGKTVQVLDTKTGKESYRFESIGASTNLIFSQDGRFLVTHDGRRAEWFDAASGQAIADYNQTITSFDLGRPGLSLSADGLTLAVWGQGNTANQISIFRLDPIAKKVMPPAKAFNFGGSMGTAALSPDGKLIAVGSKFTGHIAVCDAATSQKIAVHGSAHASEISAIAFSRNSLDLVTADVAGVIKTWGDVRKLTSNSESQRTLKGHAAAINKVALSTTGNQLVSASQDGTVRLWTLQESLSATSRLNANNVPPEFFASVDPVFFAGGLLIATADRNRVTICDAATGQRLRSLADGGVILSLAISPDNRLLAVGRYAEAGPVHPIRPSSLSLWEIDSGRRLAEFAGMDDRSFGHHFAYCALETLAFSPDGKFLVAGFGNRGSHFSTANIDLKVWDVATRSELVRLAGHSNACVSICFSPDGTRLASGSHDGTARIWDTATWQTDGGPFQAGTSELRDNSVETLAFSPDGRTLAMGTMGGSILLWNLATRDQITLPKAHANSVQCVTFSPDGRTLASGSSDETVRLWNVATGRELMVLNSKNLNLGQRRSLSFSPDGAQLLAGGAVVWSTAPAVWDNPTLAANQLKPLLNSPAEFQSRVQMLSDIPRLHEALEQLDSKDLHIQAALAATRANWHAAHRRWNEAAQEYDRLKELSHDEPQAWLRTPGLIRLATALYHEGRPALAATLLTGGAKRRIQDGLRSIAVTVGLGFGYRKTGDAIRITELVPGSPAAISKLQVDDVLLQINDVEVTDTALPKLADLLKGKAGTRFRLIVRHPGDDRTEVIELVKEQYLWDPETGELWRPLLAEIEAGLARNPGDAELLELRAELAGQWSGFADQVRDFTVVIDKLTTQPLAKVEADLQRVYRRRGDAYFGLKQWQQAVDDFTRIVTAQTRNPELLSRRAQAFEELRNWPAASTDWTQALETNPDAGRIHSEFAARLTNASQSELAASHRKQSQKVFEAELTRDPENLALAAELADQLLYDTGVWTLLKPTEVESTGGATLTRLPDGSILASGKNPLGDAYTIAAETMVGQVHAIRLEALTHESLPNQGPGRDDERDRGNFAMVNFEITAHVPAGESKRIEIKRVIADYSSLDLSTNHWNIGGGASKPHFAVYLPSQPLDCQNGARLEFRMHFSANTEWPGQNLGRFRIWVSSDPAAFESEQQRFAAMTVTDPWGKLAAAYHILGDQQTLDKLVNRHPAAAAGIGGQYAAVSDWERAVTEYTRAITPESKDARIFAARAEAYEKLERWELAAADWGRADELLTDKTRRFQGRFSIVRRAELYDRLRQVDKALADYNRAVELPNAGLDPFVWRRDHWAKCGRWTEADDDCRQLWNKSDPRWYVEWYHSRERALLNLISGDSDGYRQAVAELLTSTENLTDSDSSTWLVYTLVAGPEMISAENLARLTAAADRTDSNWKPRLKAAIHFRRGEFQQAADLFDQHGGHPAFEFLAAMTHTQLQHPDRARQCFQLASSWIQQQRDNDAGCGSGVPKNHWWGDWAIILQVQREAARQIDGQPLTELDARLKAKPQDGALRLQRARRLADLGLFDEALADLTQIGSATASSVEFFSLRGCVLASLNLADEALPDLDRAIEGRTKVALAYAARGKILKDRGQSQPARADLEKSLQLKTTEQTAGWLADLLLPPQAGNTILPTSETEGVAWLSTTTQPPNDWSNEAFDDSTWTKGFGGFGVPGAQGVVVRTHWTTNDIWLRRTFKWQPSTTEQTLVLRLVYDDDVEVYFNGQKVASLPGWTPTYISHLLDAAAVGALHAGTNTIAVHCHQYTGGQDVDVGVLEMPYAPHLLRQRFAALKLADPWGKLATAYQILGDQTALGSLLKTHPAAAAGIGDLYAAERNWEQAIDVYSQAITAETTDVTLLTRRAAAYSAAENWELAAADWRRVVTQQPDRMQSVFDEFKKSNRWQEAAGFGLQLVQQKPDDTMVWLGVAPVLALAEDQAAYADFCGRMTRQFAESKLPEITDKVIKASLLRANAIDLAKLPGETLAKSLDDGAVPDWLLPYAWGARALWAYRSGDAESAVKFVTRSHEHKPTDFAQALAFAVLALAEHQLDHSQEARRALNEASQVINRLQADAANTGHHDLLIAQILFREAEALINGQAQP